MTTPATATEAPDVPAPWHLTRRPDPRPVPAMPERWAVEPVHTTIPVPGRPGTPPVRRRVAVLAVWDLTVSPARLLTHHDGTEVALGTLAMVSAALPADYVTTAVAPSPSESAPRLFVIPRADVSADVAHLPLLAHLTGPGPALGAGTPLYALTAAYDLTPGPGAHQ